MTTLRRTLSVVTAWAMLAAAMPAATMAPQGRGAQPNVLVILIDDLGWKDTGVYGSPFYETPRIDRLAGGGARFSQFYTAGAICSPTRASLMTGKSPARVHITDWIGGQDTSGTLLPADYERQLPLEEVTVGEAFQAGGYDTGYIGKWHLGTGPFMPSAQGFAWTRAVNGAGQPASFFPPYRSAARPETDVPDLEGAAGGEYLTDRLTAEAVQFLRAPRTRPFFLVLSHYAVHTPIEAPQELIAKYAAKRDRLPGAAAPATLSEGAGTTRLRQDHTAYAAMVESVDASVGRLLDTLDALAIADNTIVVFVSDNGGLSTLKGSGARMPTSNAPLRAGKGWLYEGGIRSPLIVRWPGRIPAGAVIETPSISNDLYPTLLQLAGLPARPAQHLDGMSVAPLLREGGTLGRTALHWHAPHYHGSGSTPAGAIRKGSMKLIEWFEGGRVELYDLAQDPGERRDLAAERVKEAASLRAELARWREQSGARMPRPRRP